MKKYFLSLLITLVILGSCETEEPIPTYTLSTTVSPIEGGKINLSPESANYREGEVVTLTPEPNIHWVFQKWEGDGSGSTTPLQITMNSNKSVVGVFVKRDYPLNITIEGEGTVEERIVTNPSGREYPHGTTVELTPAPKEGWVFDSWGGDLTGSESPKTIKVDKEKNVTVKFKRRDYSLNITIEGEGSVEERIVTDPNGRQYPFETVIELTPVPKDGWGFDRWGGDLNGSESPKSVILDKEKNVVAIFSKITEDGTFFLHSNEVTCMCPNTQPGDKGFIDGVLYESVDNYLLRIRIEEKRDLSKLCTSLVTDLSTDNDMGLFIWGEVGDIRSWDVSNVTTMKWMFINADFNKSIDVWDVSKVNNMEGTFQNCSFNQDITNWNVSNVENMSWMFTNSKFNKSLERWDVSKVLSMSFMFLNSEFNQPIGVWDVSNVINMSFMFGGSEFNQAIGDWDVSEVTKMEWMFADSKFNQPIGNWNVGKVTDMSAMFLRSLFNQNISKWCVTNIKIEPQNFSSNSPLTSENKPKWGTCPED